ncbi:secretion protein EspA [Vibrio coralliilyticus]|uniref:secretion protein EspA n=1 Tax=Vibrio TaxID=662 RepID=UPI000504D42C|nr:MULTISPECIES: secretion protein EspA [Vibrio]ANW22897.1 secretion protein EspA [Vibrio coralliilyticus]KFI12301.1 secretion protein EspA [Vibrio sp. B183]NOH63219.1 secretion protein EspA [Vibrio sp. RE88]NOI19371.1 secretion protein EspA [Vibrio coralliilyticus]
MLQVDNGVSAPLSKENDKVEIENAIKGDSVLSGGVAVLYLFMNLLSELADAKYGQMQAKADVSRSAQDMANRVDEVIARVAKEGDKATGQLPPEVIKYMKDNGFSVDGKSISDYLKTNDPSAKYLDKLKAKIDASGPEGMQSYSWQDVVSYMDQHGIKVDGKRACDYIWSLPEVGYMSGQRINKEHMQHIADTLQAAGGLDQGKLKAVKAALDTVSNRASDFVSQSQLQLQKIMQTYNVTVSLLNSMQTMLAEMNKSIAQNIR